MDKEYFICKKCNHTMAKEFFGNRPENWNEEYCQDCGTRMDIVYNEEFAKSIEKLLFKGMGQ